MAEPEVGPDGAGGRHEAPVPTRSAPPSLLVTLLADPQDPGYAAAARRRATLSAADRPRRAVGVGWTLAGLLVIGLLFGAAVHNTEANAPGADSARRGLLADIDRAQARVTDLEGTAAALATQVRQRQAALGAQEPLASAAAQEVAAGTVEVAGPGLTVTVANPSGAGNDVILDRDIQLLVNGLWSAGAEAVAVGGVRLQPTSAIRKAGGAILVDNRPVFWPITIEAVGNPATLPAEFAGTTGYGRFSSFRSLYGITFDVAQADRLTLPAATEPILRYASVQATTGTNPAARGPTPSGSGAPGGTAPPVGPGSPALPTG